MISVSEIVNSVQHVRTGALIIVSNYNLGLIWGNDSIYLFDSHSKYENGNLSSRGAAVLLIFDTLYLLENYVRSVYYNTFSLTLYSRMKFLKIHCTANAKNAIKYELKKKPLLARCE